MYPIRPAPCFPARVVLSIGGSFGGNRAGNGSTDAEPLFADPIASQSALLTNLGSLRDKVDLCFIDCPPDPLLQGLIA